MDAEPAEVEEVVLALGATVDGQTTAHYLSDALAHTATSEPLPSSRGLPKGRRFSNG